MLSVDEVIDIKDNRSPFGQTVVLIYFLVQSLQNLMENEKSILELILQNWYFAQVQALS